MGIIIKCTRGAYDYDFKKLFKNKEYDKIAKASGVTDTSYFESFLLKYDGIWDKMVLGLPLIGEMRNITYDNQEYGTATMFESDKLNINATGDNVLWMKYDLLNVSSKLAISCIAKTGPKTYPELGLSPFAAFNDGKMLAQYKIYWTNKLLPLFSQKTTAATGVSFVNAQPNTANYASVQNADDFIINSIVDNNSITIGNGLSHDTQINNLTRISSSKVTLVSEIDSVRCYLYGVFAFNDIDATTLKSFSLDFKALKRNYGSDI